MILQLSQKSYREPGGVEYAARHLAQTLTEAGLENGHLSIGPCALYEERGCFSELVVRRWFTLWQTDFSLSLPTIFGAVARADTVVYHHPSPFLGLLLALWTGPKRMVLFYHADIVRYKTVAAFLTPLWMLLLARASTVVSTSETYALSSPWLKLFRKKLQIVPLALIPSRDCEASRPPSLPRTVSRFLLFLGANRSYKGLAVLAEACRSTDATVVCGGDLTDRLDGVAPGLIGLGRVTEQEKRWLLDNCECLILPSTSRAEAFGIVLLEAIAAGKPLITSDIESGMREINRDGETGLVVAAGEHRALSSAIQTMWTSSSQVKVMGENARSRYELIYSPAEFRMKWLDLLH